MWSPAWLLCLTFYVLVLGTEAVEMEQCGIPRTAEAVNGLALDLFRTIDEEGNTVISPISVSSAASFLSLFARGETKRELDEAFRFVEDSIPFGLLQKSNTSGNTDSSLAIANHLFVDDDFSLKQISNFFRPYVQIVDFALPEEASVIINAQVEKDTRGHIKEMLSKNTLSPSATLVVVNAVYFQGMWKDAFDKESTEPMVFNGVSGQETGMFMQHFDKTFGYKDDKNLGSKILELPYAGGQYSMFFFLPNPDGPASLLELVERMAEIDSAKLFADKMPKTSLGTVRIPKFEIETSVQLVGAMQSLGVNLIFDPVEADLSGVSEEQLYVGQALHKGKIVVDETGTVAAASTAISVLALSALTEPDINFIADRPFLYFVVNKLDCVVLFMGAVQTLE